MEQMTHVNATAANLFTNLTPTNTIIPVGEHKEKKREEKKNKKSIRFIWSTRDLMTIALMSNTINI